MSDDYTPTTREVKRVYVLAPDDLARDGKSDWSSLPDGQFDPWLDAHSASIRAAALDEAAEVAEKHWASNVGRAHDIAAAIRALKEEKK